MIIRIRRRTIMAGQFRKQVLLIKLPGAQNWRTRRGFLERVPALVCHMGVSESEGYLILGVLIVRILPFRVVY